jgi:hypothetical protein
VTLFYVPATLPQTLSQADKEALERAYQTRPKDRLTPEQRRALARLFRPLDERLTKDLDWPEEK